jgi:hypothetical protein
LGQVRYINLGHGIICKQANAGSSLCLFHGAAQAQGRDRAAMAAGID